jgi:prophage antirepressor-like protein
MPKNQNITNPKYQAVLFENLKIRRIWHDDQWYYSVVDVVAVLTDSEYQAARKYWKILKGHLVDEGFEQLVTICYRLKMIAEDGKQRETDCTNTKGLLRIIQSIPSKKAEPFKQWLAKVGHERLQEMLDPAQAVDRAREYW